MSLQHLGAFPAESNSLASIAYVNSLASLSLTESQVNEKIKERFALDNYATSQWAEAIVNSTTSGQAFARRTNLNSLLANKIAVLGVDNNGNKILSRAAGPIALDSSGMVDKNLIKSKSSTQTFPILHWSPSTYSQLSNVTTEQQICPPITVNPQGLSNYRLFVTGTINAKVSADGEYPVVLVKTSSGNVVARGYGVAERYGGGLEQSFTAAGQFRYEIPDWADKIDMVLIGGGGGGKNGAFPFVNGGGGGAGQYLTQTLVRGSGNLPLSTKLITGEVGAGAPNADILSPEQYGSKTTCSWTGGGVTLSANGGLTGKNQGFNSLLTNMVGDGTGNIPYNGRTYVGSQNAGTNNASGPAAVGNSPGGGGQGGKGEALSGQPGASGASGAAIFYAYTADDNNYGQINIIPSTDGQQFSGSTVLSVYLVRSGGSVNVATSSLNPQISVMVIPA